MKSQNIIAFFMAVLILATTFPAYASDENGKYSTEIEAECTLPEIVVTLPSTGQIYFNPYKLPVEIDGENTKEQIISEPVSIENESEVPLNVAVTVVGKVKDGSDMALSTTSTQGIGTKKKAFLYFEIKAVSNPDQVSWDSEYDADKHLIVRTIAKTKKNMVTIGAVDQSNHYGVFRLTGDCVSFPKQGWAETDGIEVEIAFTFTPLARPGT